MSIYIRRMREEDIPQVVEIEKIAFSRPWSKSVFKAALLLPYAAYYVAAEQNEAGAVQYESRAQSGTASEQRRHECRAQCGTTAAQKRDTVGALSGITTAHKQEEGRAQSGITTAQKQDTVGAQSVTTAAQSTLKDLLSGDDPIDISGEKIVGMCGVKKIFEEGDISNVAVHPAYRGRGISRQMLEMLMREAREDGVTAFTLEVRAGNRPAICLYESYGFRTEGIRPRFYEDPVEDGLVMWLR